MRLKPSPLAALLPIYAFDVARFARDLLGLKLDARQKALLDLALTPEGKRVILNCSRQWGKSTMAAVLVIHMAIFGFGREILIVGPALRQGSEFLHKAKVFLRRLNIEICPDGANDVSLLFPNGSRIVGLPGKNATVRGFSRVSLLIVDEAAWVSKEQYDAVKPMTITCKGALWLLSTPNGQQGFFYEAWYQPGFWTRVSVPATECPRFSAEQLAEDRISMGPRTFQQNYLCFFGDAEQAVFQRDWLEAAMRRDVAELNLQARFGDMGSTYVVGVDLGQQRDYTAIVVVERVRRMGEVDRVTYQRAEEISYQVRWVERVPLGTSYAAVVDRIRDVVTAPALATRCQLALDATGLGGPTRDFIRKERLGCKLYPVVITSGEKEKGDGVDWKVPKRDLVQGLQVMFEQGTVRIAAGMGEAQALLDELTAMRVQVGDSGRELFAGGGGAHDDLVMALGLACWGARKG